MNHYQDALFILTTGSSNCPMYVPIIQRLSPKLQLAVLDTLLAMVTAYPGTDLNEKTDKWETVNRRNFGDGGGYEVLRALMVQYSAEPDLSLEKETILSHTLQLFHLTLVSRKNTTDLLTCSQVSIFVVVLKVHL